MKNWFLLLLLFSSSCSYRWGADGAPSAISLPFIEGDEDGSLTRAIVARLNAVGIPTVAPACAPFRLDVRFTQCATDVIGYRKDRQKVGGKERKDLVASESRKSVTLEVALYDETRKEVVRGPYTLCADQDYDYVDGDSLQDLLFMNGANQWVTVLSFSLGQLESNEAAAAAASRPLYVKLAQKIVDSISAEW